MAGSSDRQHLDGQQQSGEYKMVVLRADDLHEVRSVQLSASNIYVLGFQFKFILPAALERSNCLIPNTFSTLTGKVICCIL